MQDKTWYSIFGLDAEPLFLQDDMLRKSDVIWECFLTYISNSTFTFTRSITTMLYLVTRYCSILVCRLIGIARNLADSDNQNTIQKFSIQKFKIVSSPWEWLMGLNLYDYHCFQQDFLLRLLICKTV